MNKTTKKDTKPLYKRLQRYFDIKLPQRAAKVAKANTATAQELVSDDIGLKNLPVSYGGDWNGLPAGHVNMTHEAAKLMTEGFVLTPVYDETDKRLMGFNVTHQKLAAPQDERPHHLSRYDSFLWFIFMLATGGGLLTIIVLIIRHYYAG